MAVILYDNVLSKILMSNVNIISTVNMCLTNNPGNQTNSVIGDITIATNTIGVRVANPTLTYSAGNIIWAGDAATVTATGAAYAANAVFYSDAGPKYLIAHYVLANANYLALNDTFTVFCNQGIANIGDPNNFA